MATLGRTYFVYSQSEEEKGKPNATDFLIKAEKNYIDSLDVCNKLVSLVLDMEILEMRSRLYLNLGLVYETRMELRSARLSMEKALNILRYGWRQSYEWLQIVHTAHIRTPHTHTHNI